MKTIPSEVKSALNRYLSENTSSAWMAFAAKCDLHGLDAESIISSIGTR